MNAPQRRLQFASDNTAGVCPEAWDALTQANAEVAMPYGQDTWTARACDAIRNFFEADCEVYFCFNGTAANSLALAHCTKSYHGVIASDCAHVEHDECGGPEFFSHGAKMLVAETSDGKLNAEAVRRVVERRSDIHFPKARALSVTQSTEWGTCYAADELRALGELCSDKGLRLHLDGARFANAVAALGVPPRVLTWEAGVDVVSLGGTKNGMPFGEAVVFFDRRLADEFDYRCKQAGQLASKMRFLSAPWATMLESEAWLRHARHANRMATRLGAGLALCPGVSLRRPVEVNAVFAELSPEVADRLQSAGVAFYDRIDGSARLMCSWSTTEEDVDEVIHLARGGEAVGRAPLSRGDESAR